MCITDSKRGDSGRGQQEVADLRINNEALLCMLDRERQHSHQLAQRLQQAEADALEVGFLLDWNPYAAVWFVGTNMSNLLHWGKLHSDAFYLQLH